MLNDESKIVIKVIENLKEKVFHLRDEILGGRSKIMFHVDLN